MSTKSPKDLSILLVDDEIDFRTALAFAFKRKGYRVLCASNGREAFDMIRSSPVDIVVSDIRMPGGDGIELLERTRKELGETPVILLATGFGDISSAEAHRKGVEALFSKPFDRKGLEEVVGRLLAPPDESGERSSPPTGAQLKVGLRVEGHLEVIEATASDLSQSGMFIPLSPEQCPDVSETVAFRIDFEGGAPSLAGSGVVRWVRIRPHQHLASGFGIEFTYLDDAARARILELVGAAGAGPSAPDQ